MTMSDKRALESLYESLSFKEVVPALVIYFHYNLDCIMPPNKIKGAQAMATSAILHDIIKAAIMPRLMVRKASHSTAMVSVLNPFNFVISSDKMLLRIPGALSFESNHESYL